MQWAALILAVGEVQSDLVRRVSAAVQRRSPTLLLPHPQRQPANRSGAIHKLTRGAKVSSPGILCDISDAFFFNKAVHRDLAIVKPKPKPKHLQPAAQTTDPLHQ